MINLIVKKTAKLYLARMRKFIALSLSMAALAAASCTQAQDAPVITEAIPTIAQPVSAVISEAFNGTWKKIDEESHLKFTAKQQGEAFTGEFETFDTVIVFDSANLETASIKATIDITSVAAGSKDRDGALPGRDWFFVKKFPNAVFQSTDFSKTGDDSYEAAGILSIKGVSQPLTLPFSLTITDGIADMNGQVTIDRTLWEVGSGAWSTDEWVSTAVVIDIKIKAEAN